jgi:hypothetical protein
MTRIGTIPQEAKDLAVHVALCAQRHTETVDRLDATRDAITALRRDIQRIGLWVIVASAGVSSAPWAAQAWPALARVLMP